MNAEKYRITQKILKSLPKTIMYSDLRFKFREIIMITPQLNQYFWEFHQKNENRILNLR